MFRKRAGVFLSIISMLLMLAPSVAAQSTPASSLVPSAITVVGEGQATAPAETASVILVIGGDSNVYVDPMTIEPDAVATPATVDASAIVDALVASGIPAENVEVLASAFQGEWGSGMPPQPVTLFITVPQPTVEGLSEMLELARSTAAEQGLFVNQFSVMYNVADCRVLRQQARVDAVAEARLHAEDQAAALDMTVGEVVASRDTIPSTMGFYQTNGCTTYQDAVPYPAKYSSMPFDPSQPAEVTVFVAVEVSFAIP